MINNEIIKMIEELDYKVLEKQNKNTFIISKNDVDLIINLSKESIKNDLNYYNLENTKENRKRMIIEEIRYKLKNIIEWKVEIFGLGVDDEEMEEQNKELIKYQENLRELKKQII